MFIDTHAHIYDDQFSEDIDLVMQKVSAHNVTKIYMPNIDSSSIDPMLAMEKKYPETCIAMMGLHPCSVKENYKDELKIAEKELEKRPYIAIGEIGVDLYWDKTFASEQITAFKLQIEWAREHNIPFVIHSRDSLDLTIDIVTELQKGDLTGIFHCFGGSLEQASRIMDLGFYMGIGGVLTFKNAGLDKVVKDIPLESLVLETDAPYLAPVPNRGKRNESSYIPIIAEKLAQVKEVDIEEIGRITTTNAEKFFRPTHH